MGFFGLVYVVGCGVFICLFVWVFCLFHFGFAIECCKRELRRKSGKCNSSSAVLSLWVLKVKPRRGFFGFFFFLRADIFGIVATL